MRILGRDLDMTGRGRARVVLGTLFGTLGCIAVALFVDSFSWPGLSPAARFVSIRNDILLPVILAVPLLFFLTNKLRELAIAHHELAIVASTDSLTACLNRSAFMTLVDAYLSQTKAEQAEQKGALLVIDADHFKTINDSFGHDLGDEALKLISAAIKKVLRGTDLLGRVGGEEFGVFLPGTDPHQSRIIAERIRAAINEAVFMPDGRQRPLSVSVGGATFDSRISFSELFRLADQRLYEAKRNGRNRVELKYVAPPEGRSDSLPVLH